MGRTGRRSPPGPPCRADGGDARVTEFPTPPSAAILVGRAQRCCDVIGRRGDVIGRRPRCSGGDGGGSGSPGGERGEAATAARGDPAAGGAAGGRAALH